MACELPGAGMQYAIQIVDGIILSSHEACVLLFSYLVPQWFIAITTTEISQVNSDIISSVCIVKPCPHHDIILLNTEYVIERILVNGL